MTDPRVWLAGAAVTAAIGAGLWHWTPYIGPHAHIARLEADIAHKGDALLKASDALRRASTAISDRDKLLKSNGAQATGEANDTAKFWSGQCKAAFNAGYASRRCDAPAGDQPVGMSVDLRSLWEAGAYPGSTPATAGVPAQPGG